MQLERINNSNMSKLFTHEIRAVEAAGVTTLAGATSGLSAVHVEDTGNTALSASASFKSFTDVNGATTGAGFGRSDSALALSAEEANFPVRVLVNSLTALDDATYEVTFANTAGTAEAFGASLSALVTTPLSSGSGTITLDTKYQVQDGKNQIALVLQDKSCFVGDAPAGAGAVTLTPSGFSVRGDSERRQWLGEYT